MINGFAINAAPIDGEVVELILLDGSLPIDLVLTGNGYRGAPLVGQVDYILQMAGTGSAGLMIAGQDDIVLSGALAPQVRKITDGSLPIALTFAADMVRGATLQGDMPIVLGGTFDLTRWAMGEGDIPIVFTLVGDGRTVGRVYAEGDLWINFEAWLDGRRTPAHRPEMPFSVEFSLDGTPYLVMSEGGRADFEFTAVGDLRGNNRVRIEGDLNCNVTLRGAGYRYALVPLQGTAPILLELESNAAGIPPIPVEFVPAPTGRRFLVARDVRRREFIYDRRV